ncbi:helix-turn-helix transcriptional regulator [Sulfitobacter sp. LCG007]
MIRSASRSDRPTAFLAGLILVQGFCAIFFVGDVITDIGAYGPGAALALEAGAALSLVAAIAVEARYLLALLRRNAHLERSVAVAKAAVQDVIEAHFDQWSLSPSERDVATFLVKGLSTAEIAGMRGSAEGTVKAQLNTIYRKSGTRNRSDLLAVIIDSLMAGPDAPPL